MFDKQSEEAMRNAARNNRVPSAAGQNNDMSAYANQQRPGVSHEPMTANDIPLNYTYTPGSEQGRDEMQGTFIPNQIDRGIMPDYPQMPPGSTEEYLFPGGPTMTEFMGWQKQFPDMYVVDDLPDGNIYIYRTITRYEYKVIQALPNTDPLMREELIIDKCLLYPYITYEDMANTMAGVISVLAEHILRSSGFVKDSASRKL